MSKYTYEPLKLLETPDAWSLQNLREIRLLTLLPGKESTTVQCLLCRAQLPKDYKRPGALSYGNDDTKSTQLPYDALSYVWGDPKVRHPIEIRSSSPIEESDAPNKILDNILKRDPGGKWVVVGVTTNLLAALRSLRREDKPRLLWVDALCIDQSNNAEKSQQVMIMSRIYAQAKQTIVWLGDPEPIARWNEYRTRDQALNGNFPAVNIDAALAFQVVEQICAKTPINLVRRDLGREALKQILLRPWWKRGWVVQEVLMAQKCIFRCGYFSIEWEKLGLGIPLLDPLPSESVTEWSTKGSEHNKPMLWMMKVNMGMSLIMQLPYLLAHLDSRDCTDPRDKIFSLVSMVAAGPNVSVDYTKSTRQVYTEAVETCVLHKPNLNVITRHHRGFDPNAPNPLELPSWVPDFSHSSGEGRMNWTVSTDWYYRDLFYADGRFNVEGITEFQFLQPFQEPGIMLGQGVCLDTIKTISDTIPMEAYQNGRWKDLIRTWEPSAVSSNGKYAATGEPALRAYWRTLVADRYDFKWRQSHLDEATAPLWQSDFSYYVMIGRVTLHPSFDSPITIRARQFTKMVQDTTSRRRFAVTENGYMALVSEFARAGDLVTVLLGGSAPFVLRPCAENSEGQGKYSMIGICYVHGWMDGEAMKKMKSGELEGRFFPIK